MKTIVIIPYRNRLKHLLYYIKHTAPLLKKHIPFEINLKTPVLSFFFSLIWLNLRISFALARKSNEFSNNWVI